MPAPTNSIHKIGNDRFEVDATLSVEDLNDELGLNLPTDGEFQTIGGLVFQELGRLPSKGDRVSAFGMVFTVLEVRDHSIGRLEIDIAPGRANGAHPIPTRPAGTRRPSRRSGAADRRGSAGRDISESPS